MEKENGGILRERMRGIMGGRIQKGIMVIIEGKWGTYSYSTLLDISGRGV